MIPDQEARDVLVHELDRNMIVDASAGSGKTQSLAMRMAEGIVSGQCEPSRMVAVTFTRKAASELKGRLQLVLEKALRDEVDQARKSNAQRGLDLLDRIFLGTIHSFCSRILRQFPVECGLTPGFKELDELSEARMLSRIYREVFQEAATTMPETFRALSQGGVYRSALMPSLRQMCDNPEVEFPAEAIPAPEPEANWLSVDIFSRGLGEQLPPEIDPEATCPLQKVAFRFLKRTARVRRDRLVELIELLKPWTKSLKVIHKNWPGSTSKERKVNALNALDYVEDFVRETVEPFYRQWRGHLYGHCLRLLQLVRERFQQERSSTARLSFGDLLFRSARLLRENPRVRGQLAQKYRWLYVDEFQDTDPVQSEMLLLLAAQPDFDGSDWLQAPLRPGALFVVGDPKQSIYRFRRADIGIYQTVKERILETGGLALTLTASFRSVPALCDFNNKAFQSLFPPRSSAVQASYSPLEPVRDAADERINGTFVLTDHTEKKHYKQVAKNEARRIARLIKNAVETQEYKWGDFLILTTNRRQVLYYAACLEQLNIPVESSGGYPEASRWLGILKALLLSLIDPYDQVRTVGVLKSDLFGISDADLFSHSQNGGSFDYLAADPGDPSVVGALQTLREYHHVLRSYPAGAGIERILEQSGILAAAAAADPSDGEVPALLQFADALRSSTLEGLTLAQAMRDYDETGQSRPISLTAGRENVVRVMNLHQSKGLQSPVVFLAAPTDGTRVRCNIRVARQDGRSMGTLAIRARNPFGGEGELLACPPDWERQEQLEKEALEAEQLRLLYVAATRARDAMVVGQWAHEHGKTTPAWESLTPFLGGLEELPWTIAEEESSQEPATLEDANQATLNRAARWSRCLEPRWKRTSVTAQNQENKVGFTKTYIPEELQAAERLDVGPAWGDLIHRLLENLVRHKEQDEEALLRTGSWFIFDQPDLKPVLPLAVKTVLEVRNSPAWQELVSGEVQLTEVPFGVRSTDGKTLLFGVLDLVTKRSEAWQIVDYKSDVTPLEHLIKRYGGQIVPYANHWAQITGEPVDFAGIFRVRSQELSEDLR